MVLNPLCGSRTAMPAHHGATVPESKPTVRRHCTTKLLLIMNLTAIFLFIVCLSAGAHGYTQVTISQKNTTLPKLFKELKKQTGYNFIYSTELLERVGKVSVDVKNATLEDALTECLKGKGLAYSIIEKTVVIKALNDIEGPAIATDEGAKQSIDIKGKLVNENNEPVPGASIKVKNTTNGTTTNANGEFVLTAVDENATLVFSGTNIETFEKKIGSSGDLGTITARIKISSLNEVIINKGYYTEKQKFSTGNVSTVKAVDIEKQPVQNPLLALQGRIPGMEIVQTTGLPGSGVTVRIRGQNSLQNGNDPLYIIDGIPYTSQNLPNLGGILGGSGGIAGSGNGNPLSFINPADIESIDILKDADATAIYGSRGANGVVLISTKRGKNGKMKLNVNMQTGFGKVTRKMELLNSRQYLDMRYEAFKNDGISVIPSTAYDLKLWDTTRNTDWQKELIGGTARYNNIQLSISGGNVNTQYFVGAGYHKETTVFPGDLADQKSSLHFGINNTSSDQRFQLQLSGIYTIDDNRLMRQDLTALAVQLAPVAPAIYKNDGSINWSPNSSGTATWNNPLTYLLLKYKSRVQNLVGNAVLTYKIAKGLDVKSSFGYTNMQTDEFSLSPSGYKDPSTWASLGTNLRTASYAINNIHSWNIEPQLAYNTNFTNGRLEALIGTSIQQNFSEGRILNGGGYNSDLVMEDVKSASTVTVGSSVNSIYKYNALFGRLGYNLMEKYLINLTARRDGTSRFGPDKRFHNFGAVGIGWIFSNENFFKKASFLSFGKLRGSFGTTGSDQVGDYRFMDLYSPIGVGVPYQGSIGLQMNNLFNPDLAWEETKKLEAGLEIGFLKDRIILSSSYYRNQSSNQLTNYTLPYVTGFNSITRNLGATVRNSGWEFSINTINISNTNFKWTSSFNLTINRNKLISVDTGMSASYKRLVGYPVSTQFVYRSMGTDPTTGLYVFDDGKGAPTSNPGSFFPASQHALNTFPKYFGGLQNSISYKGLQVDFLFQFAKQIGRNYLYKLIPGFYSVGLYNQPVAVLNRWQKTGDIASIQKFSQNVSTFAAYNNAQFSDQVWSDASYIRLKNLAISWQIPENLARKIRCQDFKFFVHGQNLLTFTKYKGLDPETKSSETLPPLRTITFGINANF